MYRVSKKNCKKRNKSLRFNILRIDNMLRYCYDNHLAVDDSYKVFNANYKIHRLFDKYYFERPTHIPFNLTEFVNELELNKKYLDILYKEALSFQDDTRSGEETYGYKDEESIRSNLAYICDRWRCAFRIKWLIDLIDKKEKIK